MDRQIRIGKRYVLAIIAIVLVAAIPLIGFIVTTSEGENVSAFLLAISFSIYPSIYLMYKGYSWARWLTALVLMLWALILLSLALGIGVFSWTLSFTEPLIDLSGGVASDTLIVEPTPEPDSALSVIVPWLVFAGVPSIVFGWCALMLIFSDRVGDFLLFQRMGHKMSTEWDQVATEELSHELRQEAFKRSTFTRDDDTVRRTLAATRRRVALSRTVTHAIAVVVALAAISMILSIILVVSFFGGAVSDIFDDARAQIRGAWSFPSELEPLQIFDAVSTALAQSLPGFIIALAVGLVLPLLAAAYIPWAYFSFFFFPFIVTLPFVGPMAFRWRNPGCFLLLRPFHRTWVTRALRRTVKLHVAGFGHTYTLADSTIRIPWLVRIPLLLGQISFFCFRLRKIRRPAHLQSLSRMVQKRRLRNLNWYFSMSKIFPVTCTDAGWQACVSRLVSQADAILLDLSGLRENVIWELSLCRQMGKMNRVIIVVQEEEREVAERTMRRHGFDVECGYGLFPYGRTGLSDPEGFCSTMAAILTGNE